MTGQIKKLAALLIDAGRKVCTAESCTGGLIAKSLTDLAGSSSWFERGFVTYSNEAKIEMLGVSALLIESYGAVSEPVVNAMALGALKHSRADCSIAVTGIAGPGGGSDEKPVGTVWVGVAAKNQMHAHKYCFKGDRESVRLTTMQTAIANLLRLLSND